MSILYPEYQGEPDTWKAAQLQPVAEKFIKELERVASVAGVPRFRLVDATKQTFRHDGDPELPRGEYLCYTAMANVQKQDGYVYPDGENWVKVKRHQDAPRDKIALPNYSYHNFGVPRYMVEVYRDAREPGVDESGYVWAWTIDVKVEAGKVDGQIVEVSQYRHPSEFDIEHARIFNGILEKATAESNRAYAEAKSEARENKKAEIKQNRIQEMTEEAARFIRDEL